MLQSQKVTDWFATNSNHKQHVYCKFQNTSNATHDGY